MPSNIPCASTSALLYLGFLTCSKVPWNALTVLRHPEVVKIRPCIEILAKTLPQWVKKGFTSVYGIMDTLIVYSY